MCRGFLLFLTPQKQQQVTITTNRRTAPPTAGTTMVISCINASDPADLSSVLGGLLVVVANAGVRVVVWDSSEVAGDIPGS